MIPGGRVEQQADGDQAALIVNKHFSVATEMARLSGMR